MSACVCRVRRRLRPPSANRFALFALMDAQPTSWARSTSRRRGETLARPCTCCAMSTSLVHGKTFTLLNDNVPGMLRCALSLRSGAVLSRFICCLNYRLQITHGRPSVEAVAFQRAALRLLVAHGKISLSTGCCWQFARTATGGRSRFSTTRGRTWSPRRTATPSSPAWPPAC